MTTERPQAGQLIVDGARPAVARVAALPAAYRLSAPETAVLLVLACDSFDGETSAPGWDNLASWTHMHRSSVAAIAKRLTISNEHRPALLATESTRGRNRVIFQLLLPEPSSGAGRLPNHPAGPDGSADQPSPNRPANHPAPPDAPFPSLPSSSSASEVTTDRAPADDDAIVEAAQRVAAVADEAGKRWDVAGIVPRLRELVAQGLTVEEAEAQAARSASDLSAETPKAIQWDRFKATTPAVTEPTGPTCRTCGKTRTGHDRNRDNTGDLHDWEPVGGAAACTSESPNPQDERVGEVEKGPADEPLPEQLAEPEAPAAPEPLGVATPDDDQPPATATDGPQTAPLAGPPAEPGTDAHHDQADPSAGRQRPRFQSGYQYLLETCPDPPGARAAIADPAA